MLKMFIFFSIVWKGRQMHIGFWIRFWVDRSLIKNIYSSIDKQVIYVLPEIKVIGSLSAILKLFKDRLPLLPKVLIGHLVLL